MKNFCKCALREYMTKCLFKTRKREQLTQTEFSEKLMMDTRSYAALEHGDSLCCTLTFIIFLVYHCKDVDGLLRELKTILDRTLNSEDTASCPTSP